MFFIRILGSRLLKFAAEQQAHHQVMDTHGVQDMRAMLKRTRKTAWQRESRRNAAEHITDMFKITVAILMLLSTPWDIIRAIALTRRKEWQGVRFKDGLTNTKIQSIAKAGLQLKPSLAHEPLNEESHCVLGAKKMMFECKLALWVRYQNAKGIIVPAELVVSTYFRLWGFGPHGINLTQHLGQLSKRKRRCKWLHTFRRRWDLSVGAFPRRPSLSPESTQKKARMEA